MQLCDAALTECGKALEAEQSVSSKQRKVIAGRDAEIQALKDKDNVIYRQPAPWLILGAIASIFNPLVGVPLVAAGVARAL